MKLLANIKRNKDIGPVMFILAGLFLVLIKLVLCSAQRVYLTPMDAVLDDNVMYNNARAISDGLWLGAYDWKVLAKHSFFSLWLAFVHFLGVPYLTAGNLLWAVACMLAAWAFWPVLKKRWVGLVLFAVLLFCPSSIANPAPHGFMMRVYRDNIFPALCLLVFAGIIGFALRYNRNLRESVGWLVAAGLGLAAAWLTREDGWWMLPFVGAAAVITLVFLWRQKGAALKAKIWRSVCLALPFVLLWGGIAAWSAVNYNVYGRFIVSDFSGGEFADAYGALTRVEHENWHPKIAVPQDVREKLYAHSPLFAQLEDLLESDHYLGRYGYQWSDETGDTYYDYSSGGFYWALREAASEAGRYETPQHAKAYFEALAVEVNALCDNGVLQAGPQRSSVNPPIRAEYILPVLEETWNGLWTCATFDQCDPRPLYSPGSNADEFYQAVFVPWEEYLNEKVARVTLENSTEAYLNPWQKVCFLGLDIVRTVYAVLLPLALVAAVAWQVAGAADLIKRLRTHTARPMQSLLWWIGLGLLGCILLRCAMIAYVTVSSFTIGTYIMYLATVHPLMLVYGFLGVCYWAGRLAAMYRSRASRPKAVR